jgi:hypothetical protein
MVVSMVPTGRGGAGAEMFSSHFSMRIGSRLPGLDVVSAQVSEGERFLKEVIGKSDKAGEGKRKRARCCLADSFKSNF